MTFKMGENFQSNSELINALIPITPDLVPNADPEDLKAMWNWNPAEEAGLKMPPEPGTAYGFPLSERFVGLDVRTITYRLGWLTMLKQLSELGAVNFPYFHEGKPDDAVFKALATVPMTGIQGMREMAGITLPLPFNFDELTRLIESEPKV